jgi:hypothetical protein
MNRRTVLKNLALVIGGTVLLPSCLRKDGTSYYQLKHVTIESDQQDMIADMAETIIPKTNIPGAKDLNLPAFMLKMIDDCYDKKTQQAFVAGLKVFNDRVQQKYHQSFSDLSVKDREAVLLDIENSAKKPNVQGRNPVPHKGMEGDPLMAFYGGVKQQTLFAYTTSQFFMTKEVFYDMVPGRYIVHYPVSKLKTA